MINGLRSRVRTEERISELEYGTAESPQHTQKRNQTGIKMNRTSDTCRFSN